MKKNSKRLQVNFKDIKPEENDVIVIAGGETLLKAKRERLLWTLLEGEKKMHKNAELGCIFRLALKDVPIQYLPLLSHR